MTNFHILGFDSVFTELNYLIWFLCKWRLNASDRVLDTLYIIRVVFEQCKLYESLCFCRSQE